MTEEVEITSRQPSALRRWLRRGFIVWAVVAMSWLANSVRTRGVDAATLRDSAAVSVVDQAMTLVFLPGLSNGKTALIFICGSGISAEAYAPLLRPVAEAGYPVFVIKLPYRFAPLESNKQAAVDRARGDRGPSRDTALGRIGTLTWRRAGGPSGAVRCGCAFRARADRDDASEGERSVSPADTRHCEVGGDQRWQPLAVRSLRSPVVRWRSNIQP